MIWYFVIRVFMALWYPQLWAGRFRASNLGRSKIFFCSSQRPDLLWGPPSHFFGGYLSAFLGVKRQGLEVDHLHLVPRLRLSAAVALHLLFAFVCEQGQLDLFLPWYPHRRKKRRVRLCYWRCQYVVPFNFTTGTNYVTVVSRPLIETV